MKVFGLYSILVEEMMYKLLLTKNKSLLNHGLVVYENSFKYMFLFFILQSLIFYELD
jgi:hypothetical protein